MNNKNMEYRRELNKILIAKRQELRHRQDRLNNNIFAGTCKKLAKLKELYSIRQKEKELEEKLKTEIGKFREKLQDPIEEDELSINEVDDDNQIEQNSEISETYTEMIASIENIKEDIEINAGEMEQDKEKEAYRQLNISLFSCIIAPNWIFV